MDSENVEWQEHGYRNGHQLLSATLKLPRDDQDAIDRLSDMAGPLRPGEVFAPYITAYPLPSRTHYVLARTWQDLAAPRAGCVLTRSILVPMREWDVADDLERFVSLLSRPSTEIEDSYVVSLLSVASLIPPIQDSRSVELAEALFLEGRQPIVVFEAPEAEEMTLRVLTALWPALRRNFAACSFTLAPRKFEGRHFDLVFAPKTARSRFSEWRGRRIDVSTATVPRHRWSASIAQHIFGSDAPSLITMDALGVLKSDASGDGAALRLSLLWNELAGKTSTTPTAVLGMLDIMNSQPALADKATKALPPLISQAIDIAVEELGAQDALHFLATLIGKFTQRLPSRATLRKVKRAAADLSNPIVVRDFVVGESSIGRTVPPTILAGLGDGIASNRDFIEPDTLPAELLAPLVAASSTFAGRVASAAKCEPALWISRLQQAIETSDRKLLRKVRRHLCEFLDDPNHAPLISSLVAGATPGELANFAKRIGKATGFSVPEFDNPIIGAVKDDAGLNVLRDAIAENFDSPAADRFLVSTFLPDGGDIAWIFGARLDRLRLRRTLLRLLENVSDRSIQWLLGNAATRSRTLDVLTENLSESAVQVARVLMSVQTSIEEMLTLGRRLLAYLRNDYRQKLIAVLLQRSFAEAAPGDKRVAELIDEIGTEVDPVSVIRLAVPPNTSPARLGDNIIILASSRPEIRRSIVAQVDELSDRLVHSGQENLAEAAYIKWADLISEASPFYEAQLRASLSTLPFALRLVRLPVSKLIVSSFPFVYAELLKSKGEEDFKRIPGLLSLPFSFFVDWDRAKAARRDLVDAFKKSSWPASDLLLTARAAGIENRILTRLLRTYGGEKYIEDIERDARRIDPEQGSRILAVLQEFRLRQSVDDWD